MSVFWNRLLTYSKLQKYLLLITASLSLGMICIGRKHSKQHVPAGVFHETKETTELREIVEGFEEIFRTMVEMRTNSSDAITFFRDIGLSDRERYGKNQEFGNEHPYIINTYDLLGARMQSFLMNKQYYRFLFFFRLGWSYIKGILLESNSVKLAERGKRGSSEWIDEMFGHKTIILNGKKTIFFNHRLATPNNDGYFSIVARAEKRRKGKHNDDKMAVIMDFINKKLDDAKLLDEYNLSRGTSKNDLDQSMKRTESLENFSSWMEGIVITGLDSNPLRLPIGTKWSHFYISVIKKLLQDEMFRISEHISLVEEGLTKRKDDFSHVLEERQERQKKYKRKLSYYDVTEYAINVDSNLNEQDKLIIRLLHAECEYINAFVNSDASILSNY